MRRLRTPLFILCLFLLNQLRAQNVTVTATGGIGLTGSYVTFKAALDSINTGYHQGAIEIKVHNSTTETASARLDSSGIASGANYTSVYIAPADTATVPKVVLLALSGAVVFELAGADNVTVDGRPNGVGSSRLLTFQHTSTTSTTSITMRLINGASNNSFRYVNFFNNTRGLAGGVNVSFSTSAATNGNQNDSLLYCLLDNGRSSFVAAGTAANPMRNIVLKGCIFRDFANVGLNFSAVRAARIDSNQLFFTTAGPTNPIGMALTANIDSTVIHVQNNRISDLFTTAATTVTGINVTTSLAAPVNIPVINCFNNFISLTQPNTTATSVTGFVFAGTQAGVCNFIHNTVLLGGTHVGGTAGQVLSIGINKTNSNASSTWRCRNNVSINNRTGGTTGIFHTASWASGGTLVGNYDLDNNTYWATGGAGNGPFPAIWLTTLYPQTQQTQYRQAAISRDQNAVFGNVNFVSTTDLRITGASINNYGLMGAPQHPLVSNDILGNSRNNPCYRGAHESTPFSNRKDASVVEVYTLGKIPVPYANPHQVRANIRNTGIDTLFNQQVNLTIAGANSYADSVVIDTLAPGQNKYAIFNGYTYFNTGNGTVTVSVPADSNNVNNTKIFNQVATSGTYAYAEPTLPAIGGVGFNGNSGDFVAKFPYVGANYVNQVGLNFFNGGQPFQIVIYNVQNDTPGTLLWNSQTINSQTGVNSIAVNPPVLVTGSFFVGVRQTGTVNVSFGYQTEDPIRNGTFYYKAVTVPNWADFATTNSAFRFMVEPRLQIADDVAPQQVVLPCNAVVQGTAAFRPEVLITNYGLNQQSNFRVFTTITGPVNYSSTDTVTSTLSTNDEALLRLANSFNPTTPGLYTMKVWTALSNDLERNNDTITYQFNVVAASTATNAGNSRTFNGIDQSIAVNAQSTFNINGSQLTLEAWVRPTSNTNRYIFCKDSTSTITPYALYINGFSNLVFKIQTLFGADSIVSTKFLTNSVYAHVAATYDGSVMRLYINGDTAGTKAISGTLLPTFQPLFIGKRSDGLMPYAGDMDEIRIWDTCRTEHQIRSTMHTRLADFSHPFLKLYLRLDETTGIYAADASGNCNNGVYNNAPISAASLLPIGAPVVASQVVSTSGTSTITNAGLALDVYNQSGSNTFYAHRFASLPNGTLPSTIPGGITSVHDKYWIVYRYGAGTMDSMDMAFTVAGMLPSAVTSDLKLYTRDPGASAGWILQSNAAKSLNHAQQSVNFGALFPINFNLQFAVGGNNSPLPVKLLSFDGKANGKDAILNWVTASEENNKGFILQRSVDGKVFTDIAFVAGTNHSTEQSQYSYTDKEALASHATLQYRLVQIDFDGKETISHTVVVSGTNATLEGVSVVPNPFANELAIAVSANRAGNAVVKITDLQGRTVYQLATEVSAGSNQIKSSDLSALKHGVYFVRVDMEGESITLKLVKSAQ